MKRASTLEPPQLQHLTRSEIERRIESVGAELRRSVTPEAAALPRGPRPRWISAAALVRRMSRFIVLN